ncbi:hypothetical protein CPB86DRAFT_807670 [Serendipita vermifera]|nr:hypothetical protein CPB86DRAFT_807670 [Serendipita vermifera]
MLENDQTTYDSPETEESRSVASDAEDVNRTGAQGNGTSVDSAAIGPVLESAASTKDDQPTAPKVQDFARARGDEGSVEQQGKSHPAEDEEEEDEYTSEEEDEDDDEDEEEEEPVLKYHKIQNAAASILEKDSASAIAVGGTYFAVGTHNGLVHLFSITGTLLKSYRPHSASITDMTIAFSMSSEPTAANPFTSILTSSVSTPNSTRAGTPDPTSSDLIISDIIATASLDGQAILHSLGTGTTTGYNFKRPLRSIALEPTYTTSQTKSYVCGGLAGELVLTSRSTLSLGGLESMFGFAPIGTGGHAQKVLHSGEGPVWTVRWKGDIIAWANDTGVRLYSVSRGEKVSHIVRPRDSPRADLFQCTLQWTSDAELIIGWANRIEIVHISSRPKVAPQGGTGSVVAAGAAGIGVLGTAVSTEVVVHIDKVLTLECMVAGVVPWPFKENSEETHQKSTTEKIALPAAATTAPLPTDGSTSTSSRPLEKQPLENQKRTNAFLLLAYLPSSNLLSSESSNQKRVAASPPELQIINTAGEEESMDVLGIKGYERWSCSDYRIIESFQPLSTGPLNPSTYKASLAHKSTGRLKEKDHGGWLVLSPQGIVHIRKRDRRDRVMWLVERERYEEALEEMERMEKEGDFMRPPLDKVEGGENKPPEPGRDVAFMSKEEIGRMYLEYLFKLRQYEKAAKLCPKVLGGDAKAWEDWIFQFAHAEELSVLVPYVPFKSPRLSKLAYGIILAYYLNHDTPALHRTINEWPSDIYDIPSLINAIPQPPPTMMLKECLADLYIKNRQPGKALKYFLELRRPNVFQLIRENNLFQDVQDQVLLLVNFDQELVVQREHLQTAQPKPQPEAKVVEAPAPSTGMLSALRAGMSAAVPIKLLGSSSKPVATATKPVPKPNLGNTPSTYWSSAAEKDAPEVREKARGEAIPLLVEHSHSIPIGKVVSQLEEKPYFLYLYLDALFDKDPELSADYMEKQIELYAEYAPARVIRLLQTSQNLQMPLDFEKIYKICEKKNMVLEMVWVRSRMGDNKSALYLIIDRLGDVNRAIDFAKERKDDDLWEDLLRYSETRPTFIKGLLENVSTEVDPIRIVRRIRNGLEIPGLKQSLIKILQDFNLQTSLMEGCGNVLNSDCTELAGRLQKSQVGGMAGSGSMLCPICKRPLQQTDQDLILVFLCGHMAHAHCTSGGSGLPKPINSSLVGAGLVVGRDVGAKIAYAEMVKRRLDQGCPVHQKLEQGDANVTPPPLLHSHHSHHSHTRHHA